MLPEPYFQRDGITIYHADCADVLPDIDPASVDLLLTDPPYGIDLSTDYESRLPNARNWDTTITGDFGPFDPTHLMAFPRLVLWGGNNFADKLPRGGWFAWDKGFRSDNDVRSECELAWTNVTRRLRVVDSMWIGAVRGEERGRSYHPTQKPVALMRWILERWTKPGDLILDPYMGSGPIAQACFELGRRYIGIEIEEEYCRVTVERRFNQMSLFT